MFGKYAALIEGRAHNPPRLLRALKTEPAQRIEAVLTALPDEAAATLLPRECVTRVEDMFGGTAAPDVASPIHEAVWLALTLSRRGATAHRFIVLRDAFHKHILAGKLPEASGYLVKIEDELGLSLWLLEARLLLAQLRDGLEGNRTELNRIPPEQILVRFLVEFSSRRAETALSHENYRALANNTHRALMAEVPPPVADWVGLRINGEFLPSLRNLAYGLWREQALPLPDQLTTLARVLPSLVPETRNAYSREQLAHALRCLAQSARTDQFDTLLAYMEPARSLHDTPEYRLLMSAVDAYTVGEYARCIEIFRAAQPVLDLSFYEVAARAAVHSRAHGSKAQAIESCLGDTLWHDLVTYLERGAAAPDAERRLRKLTHVLGQSDLGWQLAALLAANATDSPSLSLVAALSARHPTPKLSIKLGEREACTYLERMTAVAANSPTLALYRATVDNAELPRFLPPARRQRYTAYSHARRGNLGVARQLLSEAILEARNPLDFEECLVILYDIHIESRNVSEAIRLAVRAHLGAWPTTVSRLALERIPESDIGIELRSTVDWPLFVHVKVSRGLPMEEPRALFEAYDDFISAGGYTVPSEMRGSAVPDYRLVYFLRHICTPQTMNSSIAFRNTDALESERIKICQWLLEVDAANSASYEEEITFLTKQAAFRAALVGLRSSKIYANADGIRSSLPASYRDLYDRYRAYSSLNVTLRMTVGKGGVGALLAKGTADRDLGGVLVLTDAGLMQFESLFADVRDRFISSAEYGLDTYLSIRIRHGTLSGHLRAAFERNNLVTRKRGTQYLRNDAWDEALSALPPARRDLAMIALSDLSADVDSIIETFRSKHVQIRSSAKPDGLFDYEYDDASMFSLWLRIQSPATLPTFLDMVFDELWRRTERNCEVVVGYIRTSLQAAFGQALDTLRASLTNIDPSLQHGALAAAVTRCHTDIQLQLKELERWFESTDEGGIPEFDFDLLVVTALHTLSNLNPLHHVRHVKRTSASGVYAGRYFAAFNDILLLLLQNAVRHSGTDVIELSIEADRTESGHVRISVQNTVGSKEDGLRSVQAAEAALDPMDFASSSPEIRTEGGTGFKKLRKLLETDLQLTPDEYTIRVGLASETTFKVAIEFHGGRFEQTSSSH